MNRMASICGKSCVFYQLFLNNNHSVKRNFCVSMSDAISKAEIVLGYSIKDLSVKQLVCNTKFQLLMNKTSYLKDQHPVLLAER